MPIGICNLSRKLRLREECEGSQGSALGIDEDKSLVNKLGGHWVRPSRVGANRAAVVVKRKPSAAIARAWVNLRKRVGNRGDGIATR